MLFKCTMCKIIQIYLRDDSYSIFLINYSIVTMLPNKKDKYLKLMFIYNYQ